MTANSPGPFSARMTLERWVLLALSALVCVVVFANAWGILTPDTKPEIFLDPWGSARRYAGWWLDGPLLGSANYNVGSAPVAVVVGLIQLVAPEPWVSMRIWRVALLLVAAFGARRLYVELVRGTRADGGMGRVAVAVAYLATPYLLVGGNTTPTLMPYAGLPWMCVFLLRAFREGGWRWPAAAALTVTAMGGINAGAVVLIQGVVLLPLMVQAIAVDGVRWRRVIEALVRMAVLALGMALYWLVPALSGLGVGSSVAAGTESLEAINDSNSYAEVLRGLGFWVQYGGDASGPFMPTARGYLDTPWLVVLSFGPLLVAMLGVALSRSKAVRPAALMVAVGAVTMVGAFPWTDASVVGRAIVWVLENVPGALVLRTTNKAGGVLVLGLAILIGLAMNELLLRSLSASRRRPVPAESKRTVLRRLARVGPVLPTAALMLLSGALVVGSVAPVVQDRLFPVRVDIPAYWRAAAAAIDDDGTPGRVLLTPGVGSTNYQWGYRGFDELGNSLFQRETVHRAAQPLGTPFASGLLGGVDLAFQRGTMPPGAMAALGDYAGVGTILGRYDQRFGSDLGGFLDETLQADPRLTTSGLWGPPERSSGATAPLHAYAVDGLPQSAPVRARSAEGALLLDGDASVLPSLVRSGLVDDRPAMLLSGSLTDSAVRQSLDDGAHVVLSDSNGRRQWHPQTPSRTGRLVEAGQEVDSGGPVFGAPDQTVLSLDGVRSLSAQGGGLVFGPYEGGSPALAFDGQRDTAWRFGNFGTGVGNAVTVRLLDATEIDKIGVAATNDGGNRVSRVRVDLTGPGGAVASAEVDLEPWASLSTPIPVQRGIFDTVTVSVTAIDQHGIGPVGISEISIPGVGIRAVGRLPVRLPERLERLARTEPGLLTRVPLDVVLERRSGLSEMEREEVGLNRDFLLPQDRTFSASGVVRLGVGARDEVIDALAGHSPGVRVSASSREDGDLRRRASNVLDTRAGGPDLTTGWTPQNPVVGEWIRADFPERTLSEFTVTQDGDSTVTRAWVRIDDGPAQSVTLQDGESVVRLPAPRSARSVQLIITDRQGGEKIHITDIGLPHLDGQGVPPPECLWVGAIDGVPLAMSVGDALPELLRGAAVDATGCSPLELGAGNHEVRALPDLVVDSLHLQDTVPRTLATSDSPRLEVNSVSRTRVVATLAEDCAPCWVTPGQGFDARWTATSDGASLGEPVVMDGYASGWRVEAPAGSTIEMRYGPADSSLLVWLSSLAALLVSVLLTVSPRHRRRPTSPAPEKQVDATQMDEIRSGAALAAPQAPGLRQGGTMTGAAVVAALTVLAALTGPRPVAAVVLVVGTVSVLTVRKHLVQSVLRFLPLAAALMTLVAWFIGDPRPVGAAGRIADNLLAHGLGAATVWLCLLVVLLPRAHAAEQRVTPVTPSTPVEPGMLS